MIDFFSQSQNNLLINLYYLSGILLLFVNGLVLWQIKLAQKAISLTEDRLSNEAALKYIKDFNKIIIDRWNEYYDIYKNQGLEETDKFVTYSFIESELKKIDKNKVASYYRIFLRNREKVYGFLNILEEFSIGVNSSIVNRDLAFNVMGESFCKIIEFISVIICINREDETSIQSKYTIKLYLKWKKELDIRKNKYTIQKIRDKYNQLIEEQSNLMNGQTS